MKHLFIAILAVIGFKASAQSDDLSAINHKVIEKAPKILKVEEIEHDTTNKIGRLRVEFESNAYPVKFLPWRMNQSELDRYHETTTVGCDETVIEIIVPYDLTDKDHMRAYLFFAENKGGNSVAGYAFSLPKPITTLEYVVLQ